MLRNSLRCGAITQHFFRSAVLSPGSRLSGDWAEYARIMVPIPVKIWMINSVGGI